MAGADDVLLFELETGALGRCDGGNEDSKEVGAGSSTGCDLLTPEKLVDEFKKIRGGGSSMLVHQREERARTSRA